MMTQIDSEVIEQATGQVVAIGKAIEHSKVQTAKVSGKNKELAKAFIEAIDEVKAEQEQALGALAKFWKKNPIWKKMFKMLTSKILGTKENKEKSQDKQKEEKGGTVLAGGDSIKALSADLEVAISQLRSASRLDNDQNDLALMQKMERVMKLSGDLASKVKVNVPSLDVQKAGLAIADVSLTMKNNSSSVVVAKEAEKSRELSFEGLSKALVSNPGHLAGPDDVPTTDFARKEKERRDASFAEGMTSLRKRGE